MAKEKRYNGNIEAFSSSATSGNKLIFGNPTVDDDDIDNQITQEFLNGWESGLDTNNFPPMEYFNALGFTTTKLLAYLYQAGVPEWNIEQEYYIGSIASTSAGKIYVSLTGVEGTPNIGNNPVGDSTNWEDLVAKGTVTLSGDVTGSGTMEDGTNDVNITVEVKDDSHNHVIGNIDGLQTALNNKLDSNGTAVDSDKLDNKDSSEFVQISGDQTIDGQKTFNTFPVTPVSAPTLDYQVANKKYVDDDIADLDFFKVDKKKDISGDIDLALTGGIYAYSSSLTNLPVGAGGAGALIINQGIGTTARSQILIDVNSQMFIRYGDSGGWKSWEEVTTKSDFTQSFTTAGYAKLPNGLILQWGDTNNVTGESRAFPIAFPNACFGVHITNNSTNNSGFVSSFSNSSFVWENLVVTTNRYFAIGY